LSSAARNNRAPAPKTLVEESNLTECFSSEREALHEQRIGVGPPFDHSEDLRAYADAVLLTMHRWSEHVRVGFTFGEHETVTTVRVALLPRLRRDDLAIPD
jgi:hypothetical protein